MPALAVLTCGHTHCGQLTIPMLTKPTLTMPFLSQALKNFKGAVVTISHNEAFVQEIVNEKWIVADGEITCVQVRDIKAR